MDIYLKLFEVLFPVFFIVGIGYFLGKKNPKIDTSFITNFAANIGSPAMIIYSLNSVNLFFVITSILLISKIPTYSLKKIVVPRSTTVFLLFGIILVFGLLLIFPFKIIFLGCLGYLLAIPISIYHFNKIKKQNLNDQSMDDQEPEDIL